MSGDAVINGSLSGIRHRSREGAEGRRKRYSRDYAVADDGGGTGQGSGGVGVNESSFRARLRSAKLFATESRHRDEPDWKPIQVLRGTR